MGNYNVHLAFLALISILITQLHATDGQHLDPIYFPDDSTINAINNRQTFVNQRPQPPLKQTPVEPTVPVLLPSLSPFQTIRPTVQPNKVIQQPYNYGIVSDFAWTLFKGSKISNPIGNLILCPILVELLLSQIEKVAYGHTKEEISAVIRNADPQLLSQLVSNIKITKYRNEISLASGIFTAKDLKLNQSFVSEAKSRDVNVFPVNFDDTTEALYIINNWISNATKNHIRNLFKPDHLLGLRLLLTNTMYFRGLWRTIFNETIFDRFETTEKLYKGVTFMKKIERLKANEFVTLSGARGTWVELPYEGNEFSMVLILPERRHTLDNLIRQISSTDLLGIFDQLDEPYRRLVYLRMPRFAIQSSFSLKNVLLKMGLVNLFTVQSQIPFLTTDNEPTMVSDILQHTVLNVDEYGSVAAAATAVSVVTLSLDTTPNELVFVADQPFLAVIVDKRSKVPLFIAKIYDP